MKITISNKLLLSDIPDILCQAISEKLTVLNPKYAENEKIGRWNGNITRLLRFYEKTEAGMIVPRGYIRQLINLCHCYSEKYELVDQICQILAIMDNYPIVDFSEDRIVKNTENIGKKKLDREYFLCMQAMSSRHIFFQRHFISIFKILPQHNRGNGPWKRV